MMDGYAIRAEDIDSTGTFQITIQVPAGNPEQSIGPEAKNCAEIMTGAVVPADTNCVVPYEATKRIDEQHMQLLNPKAHTTSDCIHPYASDRPAHESLLQSGTQIGSREIAVAATCGYSELSVSKIPSIAVVSTGDELVEVSQQPEPHQIRRSNDIMIETALVRAHLYTQQSAHLPDDKDACEQPLSKLIADNQIVLLSGGVSMGKKDYIPEVLNQLGLKKHFHGIAQKPGKPMGFWTNDNCAVFTLPGNPLSTLTCLHHYVIPSLFQAMGQAVATTQRSVTIDKDIRARDDFTLFLPVALNSKSVATPQPTQNSGDLVRILNSDGYIVVPPCAEKTYTSGSSFTYHCWL
ncbi:MAG TPA: hypothetical protein DCX06_11165 [Opitutae bacterium]|nr:hypothetical protein [Opitutae bacterium]